MACVWKMPTVSMWCCKSDRLDSEKTDVLTIRMNVDSLDEAWKMLENRGFKVHADVVSDATSKSVAMFAPSGFSIILMEHIKKA